MVSYVNLVYVCVCALRFHMYLCLLLLSMTLFVCHFVPPYEVGEGIMSICLLCKLDLSPSLRYMGQSIQEWTK